LGPFFEENFCGKELMKKCILKLSKRKQVPTEKGTRKLLLKNIIGGHIPAIWDN